MKIFKKIKINLKNGKSRLFLFFNIPVFQYDVIKTSTLKEFHCYIPLLRKLYERKNTQKKVFYLKVNNDKYFTYRCLQYWLNIAEIINADYYIICDKKDLQIKILERNWFKSGDVKFIKSMRNPLKKMVRNFVVSRWEKAAYAHLTSLYHAKQLGYESCWNIDADDTSFLIKEERGAEILTAAENYALKNDIHAFSVDIWASSTFNRHWSFGVTFFNNISQIIETLEKLKNTLLKNEVFTYGGVTNLDWIFTYLKKTSKLQIYTFYVENCYFAHYGHDGDFLSKVSCDSIWYWKNNKFIKPLLSEIMNNQELGILPLYDDFVKIDLNIDINECYEFWLNRITNLRYLPKSIKNLHNIRI